MVEPDDSTVIFVDCLPGEFPVSSQQILSSSDLHIGQSFAVGIGNDFLSWLAVVENTDDNTRQAASLGVICAGDGNENTVLSNPIIKQRINNVVKQHINIENNQIVNLDQVIKIKQNVTVVANQTNGTVITPPPVLPPEEPPVTPPPTTEDPEDTEPEDTEPEDTETEDTESEETETTTTTE